MTYKASNGGYIPQQALFTGSGMGLTLQSDTWVSMTGGTMTFMVRSVPTVSGPVLMPFTIGGQSCTVRFFNGTFN